MKEGHPMKINNLYVLELNSEVTLSPVSFIIIYNSYCPVNWAFLIIAKNITIRKQNNTTDAKLTLNLYKQQQSLKTPTIVQNEKIDIWCVDISPSEFTGTMR